MVATVDSGSVTAVGSGEVSVTATSGSVSAEASVTVRQTASAVAVTPDVGQVVVGATLQLSAEAFDANGHAVENAAFIWSTSDTDVTTVDSAGLVLGVGEGLTTITANAGEASGTAEVTVESPDRAALVALYEATGGPN